MILSRVKGCRGGLPDPNLIAESELLDKYVVLLIAEAGIDIGESHSSSVLLSSKKSESEDAGLFVLALLFTT